MITFKAFQNSNFIYGCNDQNTITQKFPDSTYSEIVDSPNAFQIEPFIHSEGL